MAVTTHSGAAAGVTLFEGRGNQLSVMHNQLSIAANPVVNDIVEAVRIPKNSVVVDIMVVVSDMDTNATPTLAFSVGYGADDDYFIVGTTIGQTGGVARANAVTAKPLNFTEEDTIDIKWTGAAATFAAGTVDLIVTYYNP